MKKVTVYYTEINSRLDLRRNRRKTVNVPDEMFNSWDWSGIQGVFMDNVRTYCASDSTVRINRIQLGRTTLQG